MSGTVLEKDAWAGSATVTGYWRGKQVTIPTIGQTGDSHIFEADPIIFKGLKQRLHLPWYASSFRLEGQNGEKPVTIRRMK